MPDQDDPYAALAKPVANDDPYAAIAKPISETKEEPGFLDKEIPLSSYGNATLSGLQTIGRGVRSAVRGIGQTFDPRPQPGENILTASPAGRMVRGLRTTAEQVPQIPAAIKDINASPDPLGTYAKAAQETAGQGAGQALTALATEGVTRGIPKIAKPAATRMYQSALKPSTTYGGARVGRMVDTGLENKIPVSEAGAENLGTRIGEVNDQIKSTIAGAPTRGINPFRVASRLSDTAKKFSTQVNPESDLNAISESGNEFLRNHPNTIPGPEAQALKQGTYSQLKGRAYGELKGATVESQKTLARGLKEELADAYPELKTLNATDSRLIDLQDALEKAVLRSGNREPFGLGGPIAGGLTKAATGSTGLGVGAYMLKSALNNPAVKSRLAIALNGAGRIIGRPGVGASAAGLGGIPRPDDDRTNQQDH